MNKSFKYIILILLISFIIASLCCRKNEPYELFTMYPFKEAEESRPSIKSFQDTIFKYNTITMDNNEKEGKIIYSPLSESNHPTEYMEYENILKTFPKYKSKPRIKTQEATIEIKIDPTNKSGDIGLQGINERNIEGDFYYEPNNCKGEWSDWNKNSCGKENERCGIQFKKYEITEIEKNDQNGPGKPCPYKDGEIKYKYCVGTGNDDYESNKERCNTLENSCVCKLNNDSMMILDGENVYDLEDDECMFQKEVNCNCPTGFSTFNITDICKLEPGVDCSKVEPGCIYTGGSQGGQESCSIPSFLNEETKKRFYDNYSYIDGKCKAEKCICNNGVPVEGIKCYSDSLELCDTNYKCDEGYYYEGNPPICKKKTDNECDCMYGDSNRISNCTIDQGNRINCKLGTCSKGYKIAQPEDCMKYYQDENEGSGERNWDDSEISRCCIPAFETCRLLEETLQIKNIERKVSVGNLNKYLDMNIYELQEKLEEILGGEATGIIDVAKKSDDPKQILIQNIKENESSTGEIDNSCYGNITLDDCQGNFRCKPGYSFLPYPEYTSENDLRIVTCQGTGEYIDTCIKVDSEADAGADACEGVEAHLVPGMSGMKECKGLQNGEWIKAEDCTYKQEETHDTVWNGVCVPVSCNISDEVRELYNISYDTCSSENENCGLSEITCKKEEYDVSNTNKMIYCKAPFKVDSSYNTNEFELIHSGCSKEGSDSKGAIQAKVSRGDRVAMGGLLSDIAEERLTKTGIDVSNLQNKQDLSGTTRQEQIDLDTAIEETRKRNEIALNEIAESQEELRARARQHNLADGIAVDNIREGTR